MSVLKLKITTGRPNSYLVSNYQRAAQGRNVAEGISQLLTRLGGGNELAASSSAPPSVNVVVQGNEATASATVTFSNVATANDTILINGVTFTAKASGAGANEFNVGTGASGSATNFAASVNASVTALVSGYVTAASSAGVVTVSSAFTGTAGNMTTIAEGVDSGSVITVSGARLSGGAVDASAVTFSF